MIGDADGILVTLHSFVFSPVADTFQVKAADFQSSTKIEALLDEINQMIAGDSGAKVLQGGRPYPSSPLAHARRIRSNARKMPGYCLFSVWIHAGESWLKVCVRGAWHRIDHTYRQNEKLKCSVYCRFGFLMFSNCLFFAAAACDNFMDMWWHNYHVVTSMGV